MYRLADLDFASAYFHWLFLIQPHDLPEELSARVAKLLRHFSQIG
jgi:hypothetical protein